MCSHLISANPPLLQLIFSNSSTFRENSSSACVALEVVKIKIDNNTKKKRDRKNLNPVSFFIFKYYYHYIIVFFKRLLTPFLKYPPTTLIVFLVDKIQLHLTQQASIATSEPLIANCNFLTSYCEQQHLNYLLRTATSKLLTANYNI